MSAWSAKSDVVSGMLANDTQNGNVYGVPWFGGVRGIWYRTDEFKAAGITSPPTTWASALTGGAYSSSQLMSGFAKAASDTQISPLNAKNWATADSTDYVIPTMIKSLMNGAPFAATVSKANTQLQNVLNTGSES